MPSFDHAVQVFGKTVFRPEEHARINAPVKRQLPQTHQIFLRDLLRLIDAGTIDPDVPMTFTRTSVYDKLSLPLRALVDRSLPNISSLLRRIIALHVQGHDATVQMEGLIAHLFQIKERIEAHADVFTF